MSRRYLSDGVVILRLRSVEKSYCFFPTAYNFDIYGEKNNEMIGRCDYRCLNNEENYYAGNIGYMIYPEYRGNGYAHLAAELLCKHAYRKGRRFIYITCSPENIASHKTINKLNAEFLKEVEVPKNHYLHAQGEKIKYIFKIQLTNRYKKV